VKEGGDVTAEVPADDGADVSADVRAAYDATGAAWDSGPRRVYDQLAVALLDRSPVDIAGALAVDAGAGTGAATAQLVRRGARVVAIDLSTSMLRGVTGSTAAIGVAGDVVALPVRTGAADLAVAAFVLNHLARPADGFVELGRVIRSGGAVLTSVFGAGPSHPSKDAIDAVAVQYGYRPPPWYRHMKNTFEAQVGSPDHLVAYATAAGLSEVTAEVVRVRPPMSTSDLVSWRFGMAHLAPFVASLPVARAHELTAAATAAVAGLPPLDLPMVTLVARRP
jgi:ubiquinone/menaquinone biosynthesis C-methylase UbiE